MQNERQRLAAIDWLRVLVTSIVVAHHGAQAYGPTGGGWPIFEAERSQLLGPFFSVNAGFFMGLFFLISGYFVPASLARKGTARFIADRLVRLGIPLMIIGLGIFALIGYAGAGDGVDFWAYYRDSYIGDWQVEFGHTWFVFHLLAYSIAYAFLARAFPALTAGGDGPAPGHRAIVGLVAVIAVAGALTRSVYPQDAWVRLFWVIPAEPAHLPQYLAMFAVGTIAGRHGWFERLDAGIGRIWLGIGIGAVVLAYGLDYAESFGGVRSIGFGSETVLFPLWEAVLCVGLSVGLCTHARHRWNRPSTLLSRLAGATYGVYLLHVFIVVGLNAAFLGLALPSFAKFLIVTVLALIISFATAMALRKIPGVARVI